MYISISLSLSIYIYIFYTHTHTHAHTIKLDRMLNLTNTYNATHVTPLLINKTPKLYC